MPSTGEAAAVASEPRLFVGQIPIDASVDDLAQLFAPFAARGLRSLNLVKRPDGVSKGCAMVLFERWAEAEAAQEAHNGRTRLNGSRPLVVSFANPKRIRPGEPPEPAIAPRKLFVGQVPKDATERDLRPLFEPFGEIISLNVLRTQRGQGPSAGCAFVEFRKWAQAERTMEAHNGVTRLPGSEMPLVVKFADAKRPEPGYPPHPGSPQVGRQQQMGWGVGLHPGMHPGGFHAIPQGYPHGGIDPALVQYGGGLPYGMQNGSAGGINPLDPPPLSGSNNPLLAIGAAAAAAAAGGQLHGAQLPGPPLPNGTVSGVPPLTNALAATPVPISASATDAVAAAAAAVATQASVPDSATAAGAAQLLSGLGNLSLSDQASIASAAGAAGALQAAGNLANGSEADVQANVSAQLAAINAGAASALEAALAGRPAPLGSDSTAGLLAAQQVLQQQQGQQAVQQAGAAGGLLNGAGGAGSLTSSGDLPAASSPTAAGAAAVAAGFAGVPTAGDMGALAATSPANSLAAANGTGSVAAAAAQSAAAAAAAGGGVSIANGLGSGVTGLAYLGGLAPLGGAGGRLGELPGTGPAPSGAAALPAAGGGNGAGARGLDQAASQWKLFIGQVPMEATEQDLWALFAPLGEVLELYVLRNNQTGRSRGCAFVTYSSRHLAQQAITTLNGRQVGGGKNLVVKYADRVPI